MKQIKVGILGATGQVGQKFIELLNEHPYFVVTALVASDRHEGGLYKDVVKWNMPNPLPKQIGDLPVLNTRDALDCDLLFSALDAQVAEEIELAYANQGYFLISNTRSYRMHKQVPIIVPEVNGKHLDLVEKQSWGEGGIITCPNCLAAGLTVALKPLHDAFGIESVSVVSFQAVSGAGYPGISSLDIMHNVIPNIKGEEEKIEKESRKILGTMDKEADFKISASTCRVPVMDGHMAAVSVKCKKQEGLEHWIASWEEFNPQIHDSRLPSSPDQVLHYFDQESFPQPLRHKDMGKGMTVSVGGLRSCSVFDGKFWVLSHNLVRGAAGGAILTAELFVERYLLAKQKRKMSLALT